MSASWGPAIIIVLVPISVCSAAWSGHDKQGIVQQVLNELDDTLIEAVRPLSMASGLSPLQSDIRRAVKDLARRLRERKPSVKIPDIVQMIRDKRARPDTRSSKLSMTVLHWVAFTLEIKGQELEHAATLLCKTKGAASARTVSWRGEPGVTPLHIAVYFSPEIVPTLIEGGANVSAATYFGYTPLWISAALISNENTTHLLMNRGARWSVRYTKRVPNKGAILGAGIVGTALGAGGLYLTQQLRASQSSPLQTRVSVLDSPPRSDVRESVWQRFNRIAAVGAAALGAAAAATYAARHYSAKQNTNADPPSQQDENSSSLSVAPILTAVVACLVFVLA